MKLGKNDAAKVPGNIKAAATAQAKAAGDVAGVHARSVLNDLWHAVRHERIAQIFLVLLFVSLVCWDMPYVQWLFYPFRLFVTTIHESCHALACRLTGGQVLDMSIAVDHSGLTRSTGGIPVIVAMAGYLGTSIFGGWLIWWGRRPESARFILQTIGTVILALTVFYGGGGAFSLISMLAIGAGLLAVSKKCSDQTCHLLLLVLAVQTTLNALVDIQVVFMISALSATTQSDAYNLQQLTNIPALAWSALFAVVSVVVLSYAFWVSYRPQRDGDKHKESDLSKSSLEPNSARTSIAPAGNAVPRDLTFKNMSQPETPNLIEKQAESEGVKLKTTKRDRMDA